MPYRTYPLIVGLVGRREQYVDHLLDDDWERHRQAINLDTIG